AALLLVGVKIPAAGPTAARPAARASHHGAHGRQAPASPRPFNHQAALVNIRSAIDNSNTAWQTALMYPSTSDLASFKAGGDLARDSADLKGLLAAGEHWQIDLQ